MIRNLANIDKNERKIFKRHFLRNVIIELRFSELTKESILNNQDYLKENLGKLGFNEHNLIQTFEFKMKIDDEKPQKVSLEEEVGIVFLNKKKKKQLEIIENKIICTDGQYDNYDLFSEKIFNVIQIINNLNIANNKVTYIGLRKINTVVATETKDFKEITDIFNNSIFAQLRMGLIPFENFNNYKDSIEFQKDNYKCTINTACIKKSDNDFEIILDIDIINSNLKSDCKITDELNELNQFNYDLFMWSITDYFRQIMNEEV